MQINRILKIINEIRTIYSSFRHVVYDLLTEVDIVGNPKKNQPCLFVGPGTFVFGDNVNVGYWPSPYFWNTHCYFDTRTKESVISIGSNVAINNNFACVAYGKISIGDNTLIGTSVVVVDFDAHEINPQTRNRSAGLQGDIVIGDNVWIGSNSMILKGVAIGNNTVIAAGSIVVKSIPANVVAGGNPCKVLREL